MKNILHSPMLHFGASGDGFRETIIKMKNKDQMGHVTYNLYEIRYFIGAAD